jgi:hypothetical protein
LLLSLRQEGDAPPAGWLPRCHDRSALPQMRVSHRRVRNPRAEQAFPAPASGCHVFKALAIKLSAAWCDAASTAAITAPAKTAAVHNRRLSHRPRLGPRISVKVSCDEHVDTGRGVNRLKWTFSPWAKAKAVPGFMLACSFCRDRLPCSSSGVRTITSSATYGASAASTTSRLAASAFATPTELGRRPTTTFLTPLLHGYRAWA